MFCMDIAQRSPTSISALGANLLFHGADGAREQLLQDVHHVDQREDQEDIRREKHVRFQAHQGLTIILFFEITAK